MSNFCKKLCNECPFSKNSPQGWLAEYSVDDFQRMMNADVYFPCHMMMPDGDMTSDETQEAIRNGELKLCRGYVECIIKSGKMPRDPYLSKLRAEVKSEGVSQDSMAMWDFKKHHSELPKL